MHLYKVNVFLAKKYGFVPVRYKPSKASARLALYLSKKYKLARDPSINLALWLQGTKQIKNLPDKQGYVVAYTIKQKNILEKIGEEVNFAKDSWKLIERTSLTIIQ